MRINEFTEEEILDLAKNTYETGTPTFEIISKKCALLVVDMQDEFVKPKWSPYWVPEATRQIPKIKQLIEHCRGKRYLSYLPYTQKLITIWIDLRLHTSCLIN